MQEGDGGRDAEERVVIQVEGGEVLQLPQGGGEVLNGARDLQLRPARVLP